MQNEMSPLDPSQFGLDSFADILPKRDPIIGEDPVAFDTFRDGMIQSLAPATPYEHVVAENLISIDWEILQHRQMRDAGIRRQTRRAIVDAVVEKWKAQHKRNLEAALQRHIEGGGTRDDWVEPYTFVLADAEAPGEDLAKRAVSRDAEVREKANQEIIKLGMEPVELMAEAYRSKDRSVSYHEQVLVELERRRREVKSDYDRLIRSRPIDGRVIEG